MSISAEHRDELRDLVEAHCCGLLTNEQSQRLQSLAVIDDESRDFYVRHLQVHAGLQWHFRDEPFATNSLVFDKLNRNSPHAAVEGIAKTGARQASTTKSPVLGFLGRATSVLSRPVVWSILGVAVAFYGTFVLYSWNLRSERFTNRAAEDDSTVAMVSNAGDVRWSTDTKAKIDDSPLHSGELLKIESGFVELQLKQGAKLLVEGPAEWSIEGQNSAALRSGKLTATVSPNATGFTLSTPLTRIVDLGTEFGVEVDAAGRTDVEVITGKVDVHYESSATPSGSQKSVRMTAGTAKRFSKDPGAGIAVTDVAPSKKDSHVKSSQTNTRRIVVQGAMASSENGGYHVKALIDGSGMKGDCHATYHWNDKDSPPYHMWLSAFGKIKNEFVLFDFNKPYRLESMKVWNFNDGRQDIHTSRGVKQADIFVSTSGKWDPLKEPNEWKLVVDDFKFSVASGTDEYNAPDVIPLGNVEARFVAIVIDDNLGPDPRGGGPSDACVGLSEVQFFGEPVVRSSPSRKERR